MKRIALVALFGVAVLACSANADSSAVSADGILAADPGECPLVSAHETSEDCPAEGKPSHTGAARTGRPWRCGFSEPELRCSWLRPAH